MFNKPIALFIILICLSITSTAVENNCAQLFLSAAPLELFNPIKGYILTGVSLSKSGQRVRYFDLSNGEEINRFEEKQIFLKRVPFLNFNSGLYYYGMREVRNSYGDRLSADEKKMVELSDNQNFLWDLESTRLSFAKVEGAISEVDAIAPGFIRVYESDFKNVTPAEKLLKLKGVSTHFFNDLRENGFTIFEIGKFRISSLLNATQKRAIKRELFRWLYDFFLMPGLYDSKKIVFIIDVSNHAHNRLYRKEYGAKAIERNEFTPQLKDPDDILIVDMETLQKSIGKLLGR